MLFRKIIANLLAPPAPRRATTLELMVENAPVRVVVQRRKGMKRLTLRMRLADGAIVLSAPPRARLDVLRDFAERHTQWIAARLRTRAGGGALAPGSILALRGVPHRLVRIEALRGLPCVSEGADGMPELRLSCGAPHFERRLSDYLKQQARKDLEAAAHRHAAQLGVQIARIVVRDQASRWGSCTARGVLSFSWRLVMAPPAVLDYLAAHEVAHLREMNHSPRFWAHVAQLCPAYTHAQEWLRLHGPALQMVGRGAGHEGDAGTNVDF